MKNSSEALCDAVKNALGIKSDNELATRAGFDRANVSNWRAGRAAMSAARIMQLCDMAGIEADKWIAEIAIEREEKKLIRCRCVTVSIRVA